MKHQLLRWAASRGYHVAWGPLSVLGAVGADLEARSATGELDAAFARDNLSFFNVEQAAAAVGRWTVLLVAVPRPAHLVSFIVGGERVEAILPPTYQRYRPIFEDVRQDLLAHALPSSRVELIEAPLKAVASRLGLVRYGRNNVTYAPPFGSYLQLLGYLTDADLPIEPGWQPREPCLLDECDGCGVCEAVCPTGAVTSERVLLHAERCLTLANETAGAWPSWVPSTAHHCLIGCLHCQRFCPANAELPVENSGVAFSEEETTVLLAGGEHQGPVWDSIRGKLELLGQPYQEPMIGRNLKALVDAQGAERQPLHDRAGRGALLPRLTSESRGPQKARGASRTGA